MVTNRIFLLWIMWRLVPLLIPASGHFAFWLLVALTVWQFLGALVDDDK